MKRSNFVARHPLITAICHLFCIFWSVLGNLFNQNKNQSTSYSALYLQKYVAYRKRKIFHGRQRFVELMELIKKHNNETFLLPSSDILKEVIPEQLAEASINYTRAIIYRTVVSDLSDLENVTYDCLVFYSPAGIESLYKNFPAFQQNETNIAVFGEKWEKKPLTKTGFSQWDTWVYPSMGIPKYGYTYV